MGFSIISQPFWVIIHLWKPPYLMLLCRGIVGLWPLHFISKATSTAGSVRARLLGYFASYATWMHGPCHFFQVLYFATGYGTWPPGGLGSQNYSESFQ